jgi:uncharacterized protein YqjF (DUF2071 family)
MNTTLPPRSIPTPAIRLDRHDCALVADWRRFLFVHYSVAPEVLQPHVPYELDRYGGRAFISLVYFTLERMRMPRLGALGEAMLRPISNHPFLNVRTYVTHGGKDGICFLAEWIPNRLSEQLGPVVYGLPYRFAEFDCERRDDDGVARLAIRDPRAKAELAITFPTNDSAPRPCAAETSETFLLERYHAYTFRGPIRRRFTVAHEPWLMNRVDWVRTDTSLIEAVFPWFRSAKFHSAHASAGVTDVQMGKPHRLD